MGDTILIEACVDGIESALAAATGGAGRIELCANLVEGGTTPSAGVLALARARLAIPIHVMIRPRGGDFCYTALELEAMRADVGEAKRLGANGVVFGILASDGSIDGPRTSALVTEARPLAVTFHRAFDVCRDPFEGLEALVDAGVDRVLTSGQAARVPEGLDLIRALVERAAGRLGVLPGGGISADNVATVVRTTGVREVHVHAARAFTSPMTHRNPRVVMGAPYDPDEYRRVETTPQQIAAIRGALRTA